MLRKEELVEELQRVRIWSGMWEGQRQDVAAGCKRNPSVMDDKALWFSVVVHQSGVKEVDGELNCTSYLIMNTFGHVCKISISIQ